MLYHQQYISIYNYLGVKWPVDFKFTAPYSYISIKEDVKWMRNCCKYQTLMDEKVQSKPNLKWRSALRARGTGALRSDKYTRK